MGNLGIGGTFTVNTVEDGESAPYYFQEWFAWSNDSTTASVTTAPAIAGSWATSIPAQGSYAYLWRKSIRYVWNENTRQYSAETAQYFRMSGTNGTSIKTKGKIEYAYNTVADFPPPSTAGGRAIAKSSNAIYVRTYYSQQYHWTHGSDASDGDSYVIYHGNFDGNTQSEDVLANHLVQWSDESQQWLDLGQFKGESGITYYTHIAWATNVTISEGSVISVEGFTTAKSPNDTTHLWMGVLVNESSGVDPSDATSYTWSYTKGVQGDQGNDAVTYGFVFTEAFAKADANKEITGNIKGYAYRYVGGVRTSLATTKIRYGYILDDDDTYADTTTDASGFFDTQGWFNGDLIDDYAKNSPSIFAAIEIGGVIVHVEYITISMQGNTGARGKVGRFFYYGGTFNGSDSTTQFVINDAQAPYFDYIKDGQKRYAVYNPANNPAGGSLKMSQMTPLSQGLPDLTTSGTSWETMANDFKYLITEALFAAYAHLGSFIISGDWLISQYGTINGDASTSYTNFNNEHPNDDIGNNFIPKLAIDGLTGKVYLNDADIIGKITAKSGEFRGKIVTNDITVVGGQFSNIVAQGGTFNNITAQGGTFAEISVTGMIRTPFQNINTQQLNFDNKNGYYAVTGNVTQIGFQQDLAYEGMEMTILNMTNPDSLLTIVRMFVDDEEDLDNSFFYKGTKVRYVRLAKGHHITIKAIRRQMIFPNSDYDNCIWVIMNDGEFDLGTFGYGTYNKAAISKT